VRTTCARMQIYARGQYYSRASAFIAGGFAHVSDVFTVLLQSHNLGGGDWRHRGRQAGIFWGV
jgi:hypothetical protein